MLSLFLRIEIMILDKSTTLRDLCTLVDKVAGKEKHVAWLHLDCKSHEHYRVQAQGWKKISRVLIIDTSERQMDTDFPTTVHSILPDRTYTKQTSDMWHMWHEYCTTAEISIPLYSTNKNQDRRAPRAIVCNCLVIKAIDREDFFRLLLEISINSHTHAEWSEITWEINISNWNANFTRYSNNEIWKIHIYLIKKHWVINIEKWQTPQCALKARVPSLSDARRATCGLNEDQWTNQRSFYHWCTWGLSGCRRWLLSVSPSLRPVPRSACCNRNKSVITGMRRARNSSSSIGSRRRDVESSTKRHSPHKVVTRLLAPENLHQPIHPGWFSDHSGFSKWISRWELARRATWRLPRTEKKEVIARRLGANRSSLPVAIALPPRGCSTAATRSSKGDRNNWMVHKLRNHVNKTYRSSVYWWIKLLGELLDFISWRIKSIVSPPRFSYLWKIDTCKICRMQIYFMTFIVCNLFRLHIFSMFYLIMLIIQIIYLIVWKKNI